MSDIYSVHSSTGFQSSSKVAVRTIEPIALKPHHDALREVYKKMSGYIDTKDLRSHQRDAVLALIPEGYDCCTFEEDGSCILLYVMLTFHKCKGMFYAILKRCVKFNNLDRNGESFLHLLRFLDDDCPFTCTFVHELVKRGADLELKNRQGKTPFMTAVDTQNFTLARYLFSHKPFEFVVHGSFLHETAAHYVIRSPIKHETPSLLKLMGVIWGVRRNLNTICPMTGRRPIQDIIKKQLHQVLHMYLRAKVRVTFPISESLYYSAFAHATEKLDARAFWILYQSLSTIEFDPLAVVPIKFFQGHWVHTNTNEPIDENLEARFMDPRESIASKADPVYVGAPVAAGVIGE